ncbi:MAG: NTP transferase domain-containing protein [Chloroflexi bacterium]|nr:NTP transferase domain-containing protein [Chloroflexota bacterium]
MPQTVRKAVIPAAGLGTRFLPVTRVVPKVLLPVLDRPLIHYAVAECAAAGIDQIAFVLSPGAEAVADYFRPNELLERALEERGDADHLAQQKKINSLADITVLEQADAKGLGHAVLMARDFVGDESFAVLLPDDLIWSDTPAIAQLTAFPRSAAAAWWPRNASPGQPSRTWGSSTQSRSPGQRKTGIQAGSTASAGWSRNLLSRRLQATWRSSAATS